MDKDPLSSDLCYLSKLLDDPSSLNYKCYALKAWIADLLYQGIHGKPDFKAIDFFADRTLTYDHGIMWWTYLFLSSLACSAWMGDMVHGADMMPSMIEGFQDFLDLRWATLNWIDKIRFNKSTHWNLLFAIWWFNPDTTNPRSNVYGTFNDSNWWTHHFSAIDTYSGLFADNKEVVIANPLFQDLLDMKPGEEWTIEQFWSSRDKQEPMIRKLSPIPVDHAKAYLPRIRRNPWYLLATVFDMQTSMRKLRDRNDWLVISFENIVWDKDVDRNVLFDGSCSISLQQTGDVRKTKRGYWSANSFTLKHWDNDIVKWTCIVFI